MMKKLLGTLGIAVLTAGVLLFDHLTSPETKLRKFRFSHSEAEMADLLGVEPSDDMQKHFIANRYLTPIVNEVDVRRTRRNGVDKWEFDLDCGLKVSRSVLRTRAAALRQGSVGASSGVFDTPNGSFVIETDGCHVSGNDLASPEIANALWPIALYVIYGSPIPTAAQIAMLNEQKSAPRHQ